MNPDDELLALLKAVPYLNVHDGDVETDEAEKVVMVPLPYVVFYSGLGYDIDERLGGRPGGRAVSFRVSYVGDSREQARAAGAKARAALSRKRVTVDGKPSGLIQHRDSDEIIPDPTYNRPGGGPLFRGVDVFEIGV